MAELGHNYNIKCMQLLHELKAAFPVVPDDTVRQCMKKHRNEKEKCVVELTEEAQNIKQGRVQAARNRNKALLSHQMEQMLKLESTIRQDKDGLVELRQEVCSLEAYWEQQMLKNRTQLQTISHSDLKGLQEDINHLKQECENMTKKVTHLNTEVPPASPCPSSVASPCSPCSSLPPTNSSVASSEGGSWSCDSCTFHNHPSLDECEMCYMPRIEMGTNSSRRHAPGPCFCHPQDLQKFHSYPQMSLRPDRTLVSKSGGKVFNPPTFGGTNNFDASNRSQSGSDQRSQYGSENRSDSDTKESDSNASGDSVLAQPPSLNLNSI